MTYSLHDGRSVFVSDYCIEYEDSLIFRYGGNFHLKCKLLIEFHKGKKLHLMLNAVKYQEISPPFQGEEGLLTCSRNQ